MKCTQKTRESLMFCLNSSLVSGVTFRGLLGFFSVSVVAHILPPKQNQAQGIRTGKTKKQRQ